jgi:hypothetical protein
MHILAPGWYLTLLFGYLASVARETPLLISNAHSRASRGAISLKSGSTRLKLATDEHRTTWPHRTTHSSLNPIVANTGPARVLRIAGLAQDSSTAIVFQYLFHLLLTLPGMTLIMLRSSFVVRLMTRFGHLSCQFLPAGMADKEDERLCDDQNLLTCQQLAAGPSIHDLASISIPGPRYL